MNGNRILFIALIREVAVSLCTRFSLRVEFSES